MGGPAARFPSMSKVPVLFVILDRFKRFERAFERAVQAPRPLVDSERNSVYVFMADSVILLIIS